MQYFLLKFYHDAKKRKKYTYAYIAMVKMVFLLVWINISSQAAFVSAGAIHFSSEQ